MNILKFYPIKIFIILFSIAFATGFIVKNFLKSNYLNNYIKEKLLVINSNHSELEYKDFSVFISKKHLLPTITLQVNELRFITVNKCNSEIDILAKTVLAPVGLITALWKRKHVKFNLFIDQVYVENKKMSCTGVIEEAKEIESANNIAQDALNSLVDRYSVITKLTTKINDRVKFAEIEKLNLKNVNLIKSDLLSEFSFENLKINFESDKSLAEIKSELKWNSLYKNDKSLYFPKFKLSLAEKKMRLNVLAKIKEGHVSLQSSLGIDTKTLVTDLNIKQVPLKEINTLFKNIGFNRIKFSSDLSWLTCKVKMSSLSDHFFSQFHNVDHCQVVGELGEWRLADYRFKLQPLRLQSEPMHITVKKSRVKKMIDHLKEDYSLGYISRFGSFTGEVKWTPNNSVWQIIGQLKNTKIKLNSLRKVKQKVIKNIDVKVIGQKSGFKLAANNFIVDKGEVDGYVNYKYVQADNKGFLDLNFKKIILDKKFQQQVLFGQTVFKNVNATGIYENQSLNLRANMYSDKYSSEFLNTDSYSLAVVVEKAQVSGKVDFSYLTFTEKFYNTNSFSLNKVISLNEFEKLHFENSSLSFNLNKNEYSWRFSGGEKIIFDLFGFIKDENKYTQLNIYAAEKEIVWLWNKQADKIQMNLTKFDQSDIRLEYLSSLEKDLLDKASSIPSKDMVVNKYENLLIKAKNLLEPEK